MLRSGQQTVGCLPRAKCSCGGGKLLTPGEPAGMKPVRIIAVFEPADVSTGGSKQERNSTTLNSVCAVHHAMF